MANNKFFSVDFAGYDHIESYDNVDLDDDIRKSINKLNNSEIYFWRKVRRNELAVNKIYAGNKVTYSDTKYSFWDALFDKINTDIDFKIDIHSFIENEFTPEEQTIIQMLLVGYKQKDIMKYFDNKYSQSYFSKKMDIIKQRLSSFIKSYMLS